LEQIELLLLDSLSLGFIQTAKIIEIYVNIVWKRKNSREREKSRKSIHEQGYIGFAICDFGKGCLLLGRNNDIPFPNEISNIGAFTIFDYSRFYGWIEL
jgi:hypothetical protein